MKSFQKYLLEQENSFRIEDPVLFNFKKEISKTINDFLEWLESNPNPEVENLKNTVNRFETTLNNISDDIENAIEKKSILIVFRKKLNRLKKSLQSFEDTTTEIEQKIKKLKDILSDFYAFIEQKISV